jgi:hypothetical protein
MDNKRTSHAWEELIGSQLEEAMSGLSAGSHLEVEYIPAGIRKTYKLKAVGTTPTPLTVVPAPSTAKENFRNNVLRLLNEKGKSLEDLGNEVVHFREAGFHRSTVRQHVKLGKCKAKHRTLYAKALSRMHGRIITVEELESPS